METHERQLVLDQLDFKRQSRRNAMETIQGQGRDTEQKP
jgi:hypothetical protein